MKKEPRERAYCAIDLLAQGGKWLRGNKIHRGYPLALLFFLSPAIGELLSGSAPPSEFFNPFSFLLLSCLYGSGAIIARELKIRWKKDYRAILVLGSAYAIVEEGLMVKSFFDPSWMDLGLLGTFGRFFEVNWVWAALLIVYHAVFSIAIPIALAEAAFPKVSAERWTTNGQLRAFIVMIAGVTVFGFSFLTPYRPPIFQYAIAALSVVAIGLVAYKMRPAAATRRCGRAPVKRMFLMGAAFSTLFFMLEIFGAHLFVHPALQIAAVIALALVAWKILVRYDWDGARSARPKLSLVSGALLFLIALAPLQEMDVTRADDTSGMAIVGIVAALLLLLLQVKLSRESYGAEEPQAE